MTPLRQADSPHGVDNALCVASGSEEETQRFGSLLAKVLRAGDVIALDGELGSGKTRLVRAVVDSLCGNRYVSSPTFVLLQRYEGLVPIFHFDAYRLTDVNEFLELGAPEIFEEGGICFIEWAERVRAALPPHTLRIRLIATGPHSREFLLSGSEPRAAELIGQIRSQWEASRSQAHRPGVKQGGTPSAED